MTWLNCTNYYGFTRLAVWLAALPIVATWHWFVSPWREGLNIPREACCRFMQEVMIAHGATDDEAIDWYENLR